MFYYIENTIYMQNAGFYGVGALDFRVLGFGFEKDPFLINY